jgi:group I intron endonuclease
MTAIYILENKIDGKIYVGQTTKLRKRIGAHKRQTSKVAYVDRAINKYGWDNFQEYIFYVPESELDYFETEMIKRLDSLIGNNGYNIDLGGRKNPMYRVHRFGEDNTMYGKKHSEETKRKQSVSNRGENAPNWKGDNVNKRQLIRRKRREEVSTIY